MKKETVESMVEFFANEQLQQMIFSNPARKDGILKVRIRPVSLRESCCFRRRSWWELRLFIRICFLKRSAAM